MWSSRDIACIIVMSVLTLVATLLVIQVAGMLTNIPGANYSSTVFLAMLNTISLLLFEGRRWRFFAEFSLFTLLSLPTYLGGAPFFVQGRIHFFLTAFLADLILNSFYKKSIESNKLKWWSILGALSFWLMFPFFSLLIRPLFFSLEFVATLANVIFLMLPVIIVESLAGGYLGYRIFLRLERNRLAH